MINLTYIDADTDIEALLAPYANNAVEAKIVRQSIKELPLTAEEKAEIETRYQAASKAYADTYTEMRKLGYKDRTCVLTAQKAYNDIDCPN